MSGRVGVLLPSLAGDSYVLLVISERGAFQLSSFYFLPNISAMLRQQRGQLNLSWSNVETLNWVVMLWLSR